MATLLRDLRFALRMLRQSPGFAAVAILTLALGIGVNTVIFNLVDAVLLRSLPVEKPEELSLLGTARNAGVISGVVGSYSTYSYPLYNYLREHDTSFREMCAVRSMETQMRIRIGNEPEAAMGKVVTGNYFSLLGVRAAIGRTLTPEDDRAGAAATVVISDHFWNAHYGRSPSALGSKIEINGTVVTVVGVTPPEFFGETMKPDPAEIWLPLIAERYMSPARSLLDAADSHWLYVLGRLKPGVTREQAGALLTVQLRQWLADNAGSIGNPEIRRDIGKSYVEVTPAGGGIRALRRRYSESLQLLTFLSGAVLLIACANLANLLMARGAARVREVSVRLALGASRARLLRQSLTESMLIALAGGAVGVALAAFAQPPLLAIAFRGASFVPISAAPNFEVLGFALAISLATGIIFGIAPALMMARSDVADALRAQGATARAGQGGSRFGLKKILVAAQVAVSLVLLVAAGLLGRSLVNLENQRMGFAKEQVLLFKVDPQFSGYRAEQLPPLFLRIQERIRNVPQVTAVSYALYAPFSSRWSSGISIAGRTPPRGRGDNAMWDRVGPDHFNVLGTRVIAGRVIDEQDQPNSRRVAVVNEMFVRKFLGGGNPLGRRLGFGSERRAGDFEIVGVVEDAKYASPREDADPMFFLPLGQISPVDHDYEISAQVRSNFLQDIEVRIRGDAGPAIAAIRRAMNDAAPNLTILKTSALDQQISVQFNQERLIARLTAAFGLLALALASVGLYGVMAFNVARRTSEIGLRMALGADRARVARMVLSESFVQVGLGVAFGIGGSLAAARWIGANLYGLNSTDPLTIGGAAAVLALSALIATYVPAYRASRVEPLVALRHE